MFMRIVVILCWSESRCSSEGESTVLEILQFRGRASESCTLRKRYKAKRACSRIKRYYTKMYALHEDFVSWNVWICEKRSTIQRCSILLASLKSLNYTDLVSTEVNRSSSKEVRSQ